MIMNTNDSQFLKAYNDLVTAFFNFMNVVSPQGSQQSNLSYVASQLNQLLNYLAATPQTAATPQVVTAPQIVTPPQTTTSTVQQPPSPTFAEVPAQNPTETDPAPRVPEPAPSEIQPKPAFNEANARKRYCAYPELVNGRYKFKSSMISDYAGEDSVYKLTVDEDAQTGFVEIIELTGDILKTVANNPSLYTPLGICPEAVGINSDRTLVTSPSKLHLIKAVRGWEIAEGEIFTLAIS